MGNQPVINTTGTEGENVLNSNVKNLVYFAVANELKITNTFFRYKNVYKYTLGARGSVTIIDYVMVNKNSWNIVQGTRVYRDQTLPLTTFYF